VGLRARACCALLFLTKKCENTVIIIIALQQARAGVQGTLGACVRVCVCDCEIATIGPLATLSRQPTNEPVHHTQQTRQQQNQPVHHTQQTRQQQNQPVHHTQQTRQQQQQQQQQQVSRGFFIPGTNYTWRAEATELVRTMHGRVWPRECSHVDE
jgi:hypothetical protein